MWNAFVDWVIVTGYYYCIKYPLQLLEMEYLEDWGYALIVYLQGNWIVNFVSEIIKDLSYLFGLEWVKGYTETAATNIYEWIIVELGVGYISNLITEVVERIMFLARVITFINWISHNIDVYF